MSLEDMVLVENGTFDMGNPNTDTEASPIDKKQKEKNLYIKCKYQKILYVQI